MEKENIITLKYFNQQQLDNIIKLNIEFRFDVFSNNSSVEHFKKAIIYLSKNKYDFKSKNIVINLNIEDNYLKREQIDILKTCSNLINFEGGHLHLDDGNSNFWTIENIIFANNRIDNAVNTIETLRVPDENNRLLNTVEKLMFAYEVCKSLQYKDNNDEKMKARTITSILNDGRDIVCVGYASLFKELCSRLGIKCFNHFCNINSKNSEQDRTGKHVNNVVVIGKQIFYTDICWDSVKQGAGIDKLNFFMLPYVDKNNIKDANITTDSLNCTPYIDTVRDKQSLKLVSLIKNKPIPLNVKQQVTNIYLKYSDEFKDLNYFDETFDDEQIKPECERMLTKLNKFQLDATIPLEIIEKSIYNLNRACGATKEQAKAVADKTIEYNISNANQNFTENAKNSFKSGYTNNNSVISNL